VLLDAGCCTGREEPAVRISMASTLRGLWAVQGSEATHPIDVSGRSRIPFDEEEVRVKYWILVDPTCKLRLVVCDVWVIEKELVDLIQEVRRCSAAI